MFNERINELIDKYIHKNEYSKLSIGIIVNNQKYYFNYNHKGLTTECYDYEIGSITKTMTAHLVMKLVSEGYLELNQQAGYYLGIEGKYPTIYELLTHTSGYRLITPAKFTLINFPFYFKRNIYQKVKKDDVLEAFKKRKKKKKYSYAYSDFNYAILTLILEKVSDHSASEVLDQFIKKDLEMKNTHILTNFLPNTEPIYKDKIVSRWKWNVGNPYICAGGVSSNIVDMVKYMELQLNSENDYIKKCHIVNNETRKRKDRLLICPGWHAYKNGYHLWHIGRAGCYRTSIIISKNKRIGVVGFGNTFGKKDCSINYLVKMIYDYLARNKNKL